MQQDFLFQGAEVADDVMTIRRHEIEMLRKYTLSLACLIFFFIGAPLGAIIRKGGLGTPIVISVLLFIVYYIIDNFGFKQARDGRFDVLALLPLGIFLTYKAMNDSAVFNPDAYLNLFRRFFGIQQARKIEKKEIIMQEVEPNVALQKVGSLKSLAEEFLAQYGSRQHYLEYLCRGYDRQKITALVGEMEDTVLYLSNSRSQLVLNKTMDFPIIRDSVIYSPIANRRLAIAVAAVFPLGLPLYLVGTANQKTLKAEVLAIKTVCGQLAELLDNE